MPGLINLGNPIDWKHPGNRGLVSCRTILAGAEGGYTLTDWVTRTTVGTLQSGTKFDGGYRTSLGAVSFDGTDDYVYCPGPASLSAVTVEVTFKTTTTVSYPMLSLRDSTLGGGNRIWQFRMGAGTGVIDWIPFDSVGGLAVASGGTGNDGKWHHAVGSYGAAGAKLYLDGRLLATSVSGSLSLNPALSDIYLNGMTATAGGSFWAGWHGGDAVWDRQLSDDEIGSRFRAWDQGFVGANSPFRLVPTRTWFVGALAGVAFDAVSNGTYKAANSNYFWNHTCTGNDRFLAVDVSRLGSPGTTVLGITYNEVALTRIGSGSTLTDSGRVECWGLVNPASGTNIIEVTLSGSCISAATAVSYTNVHQTIPTEAWNNSSATNVGAADATVTVTPIAANCWVHAAVATDDMSVTAIQTSRNNVTGAGGSGANEDTGPVATPTGTAMSYTDVAALATWVIGGYAIRPLNAIAQYTFFGDYVPSVMRRAKRFVLPY